LAEQVTLNDRCSEAMGQRYRIRYAILDEGIILNAD